MRTTTLMSLLALPLALAACDSGQDTAEMNDMPMAENEMIMDGEEMPMMDAGSIHARIGPTKPRWQRNDKGWQEVQ